MTPFDLEQARKEENKLRKKLGKKVAQITGLTPKDVVAVLVALKQLTIKQLREIGTFSIPKIAKLKKQIRPAREAYVKDICGKSVKLQAHPANMIVKCFPAKSIKAAVGR